MTSRVDLEEWLTHPLIFCLHSINFKTLGTLLVLAAAYLMRSAGSPASSSNVLSYLIDVSFICFKISSWTRLINHEILVLFELAVSYQVK